MAALVQLVAHDPDSLVALALAHPEGPRGVLRALRETADNAPLLQYPATWAAREREREGLARLMRERSADRLGSAT